MQMRGAANDQPIDRGQLEGAILPAREMLDRWIRGGHDHVHHALYPACLLPKRCNRPGYFPPGSNHGCTRAGNRRGPSRESLATRPRATTGRVAPIAIVGGSNTAAAVSPRTSTRAAGARSPPDTQGSVVSRSSNGSEASAKTPMAELEHGIDAQGWRRRGDPARGEQVAEREAAEEDGEDGADRLGRRAEREAEQAGPERPGRPARRSPRRRDTRRSQLRVALLPHPARHRRPGRPLRRWISSECMAARLEPSDADRHRRRRKLSLEAFRRTAASASPATARFHESLRNALRLPAGLADACEGSSALARGLLQSPARTDVRASVAHRGSAGRNWS